MIDLIALGQTARTAARKLAKASTAQKTAALLAIADCLESSADGIRAANDADLTAARAKGIGEALIDRLSLQGTRLGGIIADVRSVAELPDPVGEVIESYTRPNGLRVSRRRTPLGVLGVIYEARPNVTVDVATLAVKSGNAVILRGGSETLNSNKALTEAIRSALASAGLPADAVQLIDSTDRKYVGELLKLYEYVDMIIPRGGQELHKFCRENSTIPVITGGIGVNHLYVDQTADQDAALRVIHNAKTQRPTVCNALGTLLVHEPIAVEFIPRVIEHLGASGVTFRADPQALAISHGDSRVIPAGPNDWDIEWLALILGIRVVDGMDMAIEHIQQHSTAHSDGILTRDMDQAARFVDEVDSAAVFVNASTRFNDGGQLGLGAEIAVSTQKLQARGPMGLRELTTYKWVIEGDGHVRQ
ncbi:MAG: glutamate-5-semialdehyde dehydrogenase [Aggregatilineales bacterium]